MWAILDGCIIVVWRGVQRDTQPHGQLYAPMCTRPIWVLNYHVPSVPEPSLTLMPSNAMASGHIPPGPQTLSKAYFIYLPIFFYISPPASKYCCVTMLYRKGHFCKKLHCIGLLKSQEKVFSSVFCNIMSHKVRKVTCVNMFLYRGL